MNTSSHYERNRQAILRKRRKQYRRAKKFTGKQKCNFCGKEVPKRRIMCDVAYCNIGCKAAWQRLQRPVTKEWLIEKYIKEQLDCSQIAKLVNRDSKTVWCWLRDDGIPTRKRGVNWKENLGFWLRGEPSPMKGKKLSSESREKIRQARIKDGRVPYLKNGKHWLKGKRGKDTPNWKGGLTPERQAFYSSPEWQSVARKARKRDNFTCQRCGKERRMHRDLPFDLHHIVSFAYKKLRAELTNLVYLCEPCHYWVHGKQNKKRLFIKEAPRGSVPQGYRKKANHHQPLRSVQRG